MAVKAVGDGLAVDEHVWLAVSCIMDGLSKEQRFDEAGQFLKQVHDFEATTQDLIQVSRKQAKDAGLRPPPDRACKEREENNDGCEKVVIYATPAAREKKESLKTVEKGTLGADGYRGLCVPWRRKSEVRGHYQVTKEAIDRARKRGLSITPKAEDVMADASQDPDSFAWSQMAAHGQTGDTNGVPSEKPEDAEANFRQWVVGWFEKAAERCRSADPRVQLEGIYLLGYAMHAIEDVASHRGRTNPEHAYNALFEDNPDKVIGVDALAAEMAADGLLAAINGKAASCVGPLKTLKAGLLLFPQKRSAFAFTWDGTPVSFALYELSANQFKPHKDVPSARVRWFGPVGPWPNGQTCQSNAGCKHLLEQLTNALK
jgi:hypothetical protein